MLKQNQECQLKLQRCGQVLGEGFQRAYPLNNATQNELRCVQEGLGFRDEDIAPIEARIPTSSKPTKLFQGQPLSRREKVTHAKLPVKVGVISRAKIPWLSNIKLPRVSIIPVTSVLRNSTLLMGATVFIIGILTCGATLQPRHPVDSTPKVRPIVSSISRMSAEKFHSRGVKKYVNADYQGAIEDFNQAIQLNPNNSTAYYNRGLAKSIF